MRNLFATQAEAAGLIRSGAVLVVAGAEALLMGSPRGRWVGGTTAYFIADGGGTSDTTHLFCSVIDAAEDARVVVLPPDQLGHVTAGRYANGFSYLLLPARSEAHRRYALEAPGFPGLYDQPLMGWIAGVHLDEIGRSAAKVVDGSTGMAFDNAGAALHVQLPSRLAAEVDIVNIFSPGDGPAIVFPGTGFSVNACTLDGKPGSFARAIAESGGDMRLPLVADYAGAMINVSIQSVDAGTGEVQLYAPVVAGETYHLARPIADIGAAYSAGVGAPDGAGNMLSCNCILNFLYAGLEGKRTGGFVGPVTFGEIAYNLVNQTLVHLELTEVPGSAELLPAWSAS